MAYVMQPRLNEEIHEVFELQATPTYQRSSASASTTASSRSASISDPEDVPSRPIRRNKTFGGINAVKLDMDYPSGLVARDSDDDEPIRRSKTTPAFDDKGLANIYPIDLIVRNTFLEFVEEPAFLQVRRVKSAPSSPVAAACTTPIASQVAAVLNLASMLDTTPILGSPDMPSVGSAQHHLRECTPCAFFWKPAGCSNGANCTYCHLCDASEKKRRQKEKKALFGIKSQAANTVE